MIPFPKPSGLNPGRRGMKTANLWALLFLTWATCFRHADTAACNGYPLGTRLALVSRGRVAHVVVRSRLGRPGLFIDASPAVWAQLGLPLRLGKVAVSVRRE